jgi:ADP-ribose pyrophosphatase
VKTVYENPWFRVIQDGRFHYIKETGADNGAVVLARQGGDFLFVRVRRPAHGDTFIEAPRGYGEPGESAAGCAARELCEETGYTVPPQALVALGRLRPNSAIFASSVQAFFAEIGERGVGLHHNGTGKVALQIEERTAQASRVCSWDPNHSAPPAANGWFEHNICAQIFGK